MDDWRADRRHAARARRRQRRLIVVAAAALAACGVAAALLATRDRDVRSATRSTVRTTESVASTHAAETMPAVQGPHDRPVPILMYHVIAEPIANAPYPDLYVPREDFAAEMKWLDGHGYHAVTLRRVFDYWRTGEALPPHPVVVSFDDGYHSHYTSALPVLRALRWPGVLNLEVRNERHSWGLRPPLLRALVRAGWEIDAHTINHPDLTTLTPGELRHEVSGSRDAIRSELHVPVDFFCYPSGRYDDAVVEAVREAGYLGATTTRFGLGDPAEPFTLKRVRIDGSDGVAGFAAKLESVAH
jgi:peptidoglycan/xylan/chitin deacetylase (PgdA/CDA1 family)